MHNQMSYPDFDLIDVVVFKSFKFFAIGYFSMIAFVSFDNKIINNWATVQPIFASKVNKVVFSFGLFISH